VSKFFSFHANEIVCGLSFVRTLLSLFLSLGAKTLAAKFYDTLKSKQSKTQTKQKTNKRAAQISGQF